MSLDDLAKALLGPKIRGPVADDGGERIEGVTIDDDPNRTDWTHEAGSDSDGVPNLEFGQYADGEWIAGEPGERPATQDLDQIGRLWNAGMVEVLRGIITERLVGVRDEQADRWSVTVFDLSDGEPKRVAEANPSRVGFEVRRTDTGETVRVGPTASAAASEHLSGVVTQTVPFVSTVIGEVWAVSVGADHPVEVWERFRSGLAPGYSVDHGGR